MDDSKLRAFVRRVIRASWDGDVEEGDVQEWAVDAGLLVPTTMAAPCGENCQCEELDPGGFPTTCYRFSSELDDTVLGPDGYKPDAHGGMAF